MTQVLVSPRVRAFVEADIVRTEEQRAKAVNVDGSVMVKKAPPPIAGPIYRPPPPAWYARWWFWLTRRIIFGGPVRIWLMKHCRVCSDSVNLVPRAAKFLYAVTGPRVTKGQYLRRMEQCGGCSARVLQIQTITAQDKKTGMYRTKEYCGACGCGQWYMAELKRKNRLERWKCPMRLHEGEYGDELYRDVMRRTLTPTEAEPGKDCDCGRPKPCDCGKGGN